MTYTEYIRYIILISMVVIAILALLGTLFHMMGWDKKIMDPSPEVEQKEDPDYAFVMQTVLAVLNRIHDVDIVKALNECPKFTATPNYEGFVCYIGGNTKSMVNFLMLFPIDMDYVHYRTEDDGIVVHLTMDELIQLADHLDLPHSDSDGDVITKITPNTNLMRNPTPQQ